MVLRKLTNGAVTSTGTVTVQSGILGGVLITTNNTNAVTVVCHRDDASGQQILDISTVTAMFITGPFDMEQTQSLYYSVSGTGGAAQFYEWVE